MMTVEQHQSAIMLSDLLAGMVSIPADADRQIKHIQLDSRKVSSETLFIALSGRRVNGIQFIDQAIAAGAVAVLWETDPSTRVIPVAWRTAQDGRKVSVIAVPELSDRLGEIANRFYQQASHKLYVTGITGTNGKTSTSQFLAEVLQQDAPCGVIGTLGQGIFGDLHVTGHTTPDVLNNHRIMAELLTSGADNVVMEVSSHALDQGRVNGIAFDCAVFTNLTHEHLDYHGDMENYGAVKRRLFEQPELRAVVINVDDEFGRTLPAAVHKNVQVITYGLDKIQQPDLLATDILLSPEGMNFKVTSAFGTGFVQSGLLGRFNISNLLAVLGVLLAKGVDFQQALARVGSCTTVAGRMERFGGQHDLPLVIVDYAHTPDALEHVLKALQEHSTHQLWCVLGCGGDRDRQKRPVMGRIAQQYADHVVVTDDNPRHEVPQVIIQEILGGMNNPVQAVVQRDRRKAIEHAIQQAGPEDIVLIAGKGHETYQQIGDQKRPFSDITEVLLQLKLRKS